MTKISVTIEYFGRGRYGTSVDFASLTWVLMVCPNRNISVYIKLNTVVGDTFDRGMYFEMINQL